ncbi:hypothetical protein C8R44DRAFT_736214 [Mycena epipterygia]|nr:hypothetical protein C8R44DRAFT_736214 [Mycena epipterygia]
MSTSDTTEAPAGRPYMPQHHFGGSDGPPTPHPFLPSPLTNLAPIYSSDGTNCPWRPIIDPRGLGGEGIGYGAPLSNMTSEERVQSLDWQFLWLLAQAGDDALMRTSLQYINLNEEHLLRTLGLDAVRQRAEALEKRNRELVLLYQFLLQQYTEATINLSHAMQQLETYRSRPGHPAPGPGLAPSTSFTPQPRPTAGQIFRMNLLNEARDIPTEGSRRLLGFLPISGDVPEYTSPLAQFTGSPESESDD